MTRLPNPERSEPAFLGDEHPPLTARSTDGVVASQPPGYLAAQGLAGTGGLCTAWEKPVCSREPGTGKSVPDQ